MRCTPGREPLVASAFAATFGNAGQPRSEIGATAYTNPLAGGWTGPPVAVPGVAAPDEDQTHMVSFRSRMDAVLHPLVVIGLPVVSRTHVDEFGTCGVRFVDQRGVERLALLGKVVALGLSLRGSKPVVLRQHDDARAAAGRCVEYGLDVLPEAYGAGLGSWPVLCQ